MFAYDTERPVPHNVNLTIQSGETVAFVGPSGAGKTTLCSLLPRFYDVTAGQITIDGQDIRGITLASLRRQIGVVQQDVFLFFGTIRENIQTALVELSQGRTTLVIAHRLATIKHADRIIVVTEQGITEQGTHRELVGAGGMYSRLHQGQFSM